MKPIGACIFVVCFLMILASLVRFYVFVMPPGGSKMLAVDVSIGPYQCLGRSPSYHEVLTPVQLLLRLQNHHHHTQAAATTSQTSLAMDQEEKKQVQSIRDQLKGHSLPDGGEILGSINSSSSEFTATNNRAHIVRQYESGSTASDRKTTRETPDRKEITFSLFSLEDLRQYFVRKLIMAVPVCILLAIYIFCSKVSLHLRVRSSTQPSASQQVEIVERILLSLSDDFAAAIGNSPLPYQYVPAPFPYVPAPFPYEEIRIPPVPAPYPYEEIRIPPVPVPCYSGSGYSGSCHYVPAPCPGVPAPYLYEEIRIPPVPAPVPAPPRKAPEKPKEPEKPKPKEPEKPKLPPRRGQVKSKLPPRRGKVKSIVLENLQQYFGHKRKDVAASLDVSVSTFKRICRQQGIKRWRNRMGSSGGVSKLPNQHGERNTSTTCDTPSHNVQTGMEGELFGQNEVANVFRRDFMRGPIALNTESGLIMVSRPPDQHGEMNTSTACKMPSCNVETGMEVEPVGQNPEANVFRGDFMGGPIALNTDGLTFPECSDVVAPSQPMATILDTIPHLTGDSSECAFQVKNQSTQFSANPYPNGLVDHWTGRSCFDLALSQPMPTIPHATGCSEYWRNSLALLEEHLLEENDYGSINLTALSCFDPGLSQPMHTIPYTMPTIPQMIPLLTERQDMIRSVRLKATYGNTTIKFPLPSGFSELEEEVSKRLEFERGRFKLEYKDEEGDSVLITCDEDVRDYLQLLTSLGNQVVKLFVLDKVPNTTNFCDNCRSLKCTRP